MKKPVLVGILIVAAILGIMVYSSLNLSAHRVEVCINFKGIENCKTARGATQEDAIRTADWRMHRFADRVELFDMRSDIAESTEVAAKNPAAVASLKAQMDAWAASLGAALEALDQDETLRRGLGEDFVACYAQIKRAEALRFAQADDPDEFQRREYFSRI